MAGFVDQDGELIEGLSLDLGRVPVAQQAEQHVAVGVALGHGVRVERERGLGVVVLVIGHAEDSARGQ